MTQLIDFTQRILEESGALVDRQNGDTLEALLPSSLRDSLKTDEWARFSFCPPPKSGSHFVGLESDWLDRFSALLADAGRAAQVVLAPDLPKLKSAEKIAKNAAILENATFRLVGVHSTWTRYQIMTFRYQARSDDQREGLISFGLNLKTGSVVEGLPTLPGEYARQIQSTLPPDPSTLSTEMPPLWERARLEALARRILAPRIRVGLDGFIQGMQRRLSRDTLRVHEYHQLLIDEAWNKIQRYEASTSAKNKEKQIERERLRIRTIEREDSSKVKDLQNKYALSIRCTLLQSLDLITPVHRFEISIRRRKKERAVYLDFGPILKKLEAMPDEFGDSRAPSRWVCDDALHVVGAPGYAPCDSCQKVYCRICHSACSRCPL